MNNILFGGISGMTSQAAVWPLEFMKTVKQFPVKSENILLQTVHYTRTNGLWAMYRGMFPPVFFAFPRAALRFEIYDQIEKKSKNPLNNIEKFNAGVLTGCAEAFLFMTPSEMLKIYSIRKKKPIYNAISEIYKDRGIKGLWNGGNATTIKQGLTQGITFLTVDRTKDYIDSNYNYLKSYSSFFGGLIGGSLAVIVNNPLDVIKTRQQITTNKISLFYVGNSIFKNEGISGLYRGAVLRAVRLGLLQAITFYIYDILR